MPYLVICKYIISIIFVFHTSCNETLHFRNLKVNHKLLLNVQMHMSSNMLQSVETSMFKEHSRKNYVRDVDICTQVYYSFIETI
jgi:hypothetical protein